MSSSSPVDITFAIRARRPIVLAGRRLERGEVYLVGRAPSEERFRHFQRNLRWSAFEVVELERKAVKAALLDGIVGVTRERLVAIDQLEQRCATQRRQIEELHARLRELQGQRLDLVRELAAAAPARLDGLEDAEGVIAQARRALAMRARHVVTPLDRCEALRPHAELLRVLGLSTCEDLAAQAEPDLRLLIERLPQDQRPRQTAAELIQLAVDEVDQVAVLIDEELLELPSMRPEWLRPLADAGLGTIAAIAAAEPEQLDQVEDAKGIGPATALDLVEQARRYQAEQEGDGEGQQDEGQQPSDDDDTQQ